MRTVKQKSLLLNPVKQTPFNDLSQAYAYEKDHWLNVLKDWKWQAFLDNPRKIRDTFVHEKYQSRNKLQARQWKLALDDVVDTWDGYWQSLFVQIRRKISYCKTFTSEEKHYAYWMLKGYQQFAEMMQGILPKSNFSINEENKRHVVNYIQRSLKAIKKKSPSVKRTNIVKFDSNCYSVFEHKGRQYLKLMSLEKGKRIIVPLIGNNKISGNITVVGNDSGVTVHISQKIKQHRLKRTDTIEAVDFGYTEVVTDTEGKRYGKNLGKILTNATKNRHKKMQKRNRLHALEKQYRTQDPIKAKHLKKYNLGRKKLNYTQEMVKASVAKEINTGINTLLKEKDPAVLITERLDHFIFKKSKSVNRKLSAWVSGELQDRVSFKALAKGFRHEQVNPAYGSQICPKCGFVDFKNRNGDKFKCLFCGHESAADEVAALNYKRRFGDREIGLYMPYNQVKTIFLERFHRRLEAEKSATVPGRTLDTVAAVNSLYAVETIKTSQPGENISFNRAVTQRAKQNKHVLTRF